MVGHSRAMERAIKVSIFMGIGILVPPFFPGVVVALDGDMCGILVPFFA